jgi:hypothetical protein
MSTTPVRIVWDTCLLRGRVEVEVDDEYVDAVRAALEEVIEAVSA